ncbi:MAG: hypothetical protein EOO46_03785 [Flavobacterium sp.]|nr:MAG: hypothetical protein EOO46_03785 [Flavobacterium sp.]
MHRKLDKAANRYATFNQHYSKFQHSVIANFKILILLLLSFTYGFSQTEEKTEKIIEPDSIQYVKKPCPYQGKDNKVCPFCKKSNAVIPIVYGMIAKVKFKDKDGNSINANGLRITSEDLKKKDEDEYISGGCVVKECQPYWFCKRDKKEF